MGSREALVRRISIMAAVVAAGALALSAPASASTTKYTGTFVTSGTLTFKLIQDSRGRVRMADLSFVKFPLSCEDGTNTETSGFSSDYRPRQPYFPTLSVWAMVTKPGATRPLSTLTLGGTVTDEGASARGTMRIHGRKVATDDPGGGSTDRCDSGKVHWSASSG